MQIIESILGKKDAEYVLSGALVIDKESGKSFSDCAALFNAHHVELADICEQMLRLSGRLVALENRLAELDALNNLPEA